MASSRIFIKGLPPSITEADFKKHFSSGGREVTDARLFANRRIGYVGYKTPEDAQSAVKYFNKTFVRMSRIGVEVARPIGESNPGRPGGRAPTAARESHEVPTTAPNAHNDANAAPSAEEDPKLKEYLEVMKPKSKKRTWENDDALLNSKDDSVPAEHHMAVDAGASDDEYEEVPRKNKRTKVDSPSNEQAQVEATPAEVAEPPSNQVEETAQDNAAGNAPVSDADWARSRTSRLLGLLDDEEEEEEVGRPKARAASVSSSDMEDAPSKTGPTRTTTTTTTTEPVTAPPPTEPTQPDTEAEPTGVRASMRLFVRNLPYGVQEADLQSEFEPYGNLEEVRIIPPSTPFLFKMST
jgi:multiple RNA-binding domain-containing protein 1